jgi:hypothetical protein
MDATTKPFSQPQYFVTTLHMALLCLPFIVIIRATVSINKRHIFRPNLKMNTGKRSPLSETCYWVSERTVDTDSAADGIPYPLVAGCMGPESFSETNCASYILGFSIIYDSFRTAILARIKVKVKFNPEQATKTDKRSRGIALVFF